MKTIQPRKIFILEDDAFMRDLIVRKLKADGAEVATADKGEGAFEAIKAMMPDMTILDIMVPGGIDGLEVLRLMRADTQTRPLPVIILSNLSEQAQIDKAKALVVNSYLVKATMSIEKIAVEVARQIQESQK